MNRKYRLVESVYQVLDKNNGTITLIPGDLKPLPGATLHRELEFEFSLNPGTLEGKIKVGDEWWTLLKWDPKNLGALISQLTCTEGRFEGYSFEPAFSPEGEVFVVTPSMDEYDEAFNEMTRRFNCATLKKTKKWIPGNRYDSENKTYYYLGQFLSHKRKSDSSEFLSGKDLQPCYLVCENPRGLTKISEILKTLPYGRDEEGIQVLYTLPAMVNSGKAITDDAPTLETLWEDQFPQSALETFAYCSNPEHGPIEGRLLEKVESLVREKMMSLLVRFYDLNYNGPDSAVLKENDLETNVINLGRLYISNLEDPNVLSRIYYPIMFRELGVDLDDIAKQCLSLWAGGAIMNDQYFKYYKDYFKYRPNKTVINQRKTSLGRGQIHPGRDKDKAVLESLPTELGKTCRSIVDNALLTGGLGVEHYSIRNAGSKSNPKLYIVIRLTLQDIMNYYPQGLPQSLMTEIVETRFQELDIEADKERGIR